MGYGIEIINKGAIFDGHIHTRRSDGELSGREIIRVIAAYNHAIREGRVKAEPLADIAFTDHHSAKSFDEYEYLAKGYGINLIPGIEISTQDYRSCHILGYGMKGEDARKKLNAIYKEDISAREKKLKYFIDAMEIEHGILLDPDFVQDMVSTHALSRKKIVTEARKITGDTFPYRQFFEKTVGSMAIEDQHGYKHTAAEAIRTIRDAGGVAVLAHPWAWQTREGRSVYFRDFQKALPPLIDAGLQGIEISQNAEKSGQEFYKNIIKEHGLLTLGGSDFHNPSEKKLGNLNINREHVIALREKIKENSKGC
jgi:predicted metal-dependent phosphoesterase TrpH